MKLFYLATPYSKYAEGLDAAYKMACDNAAFLLKRGVPVFSPIAHTHSIAQSMPEVDPRDSLFWLDTDWPMLDAATGLIVVEAPGWEESHGVTQELKYARRHAKPVFGMRPLTMPEGLRAEVWR